MCNVKYEELLKICVRDYNLSLLIHKWQDIPVGLITIIILKQWWA